MNEVAATNPSGGTIATCVPAIWIAPAAGAYDLPGGVGSGDTSPNDCAGTAGGVALGPTTLVGCGAVGEVELVHAAVKSRNATARKAVERDIIVRAPRDAIVGRSSLWLGAVPGDRGIGPHV
jgi:hypothetical protein